ncbi:acyl-phosphate glycerol 3-phosphate acyltransferase [Geothermobacter hydrogeniphilus]|uniref:Acyl-phosphate glycerol 3-phosphate acyltransferase n=1 Tax=Geothermobacter hydrogeniphilus TaxID=1969733 RepID=A0A2K2HDY3_9BACT|nr:AMP-binding protein [Geothermobacter hydrogeniphilus]PNU21512.1 acyl-phosphate glycerol 3-phosphate acyltransferase [Geothermobacter hydrogeniphilus]
MNNNRHQQTGRTAEDLLDVLRRLREELHPGRQPTPAVTLDSSLDQALGFDSLGRMELVQRLERHFGIALAETTFADAETARDLLRAVLTADTARTLGAPERVRGLVAGAAEAAPHSARTLPEVLSWHLDHQPDRPHIHFYTDEGDAEILSYRQLHAGAARVAAGLRKHGLMPGSPVSIMLPSEANYFFAFWGTLLAGGVPVPIYPPARKAQMEEHLRRQVVILENCRATHLITMPEARTFGRLLKANLPGLRALLTVDELSSAATNDYVAPAVQETDTAFLQYTSGSTGNPKGVILTHANLLANIRAMGRAVEVDDTDVVVSWLPLYHDMGLIGCWLSCLYHAAQLVLLSPLDFLNRPVRWLHAIHRHRGTLSPAPNFAYEICLTRLSDDELAGLDLSSWRCAFNGAEAVSANSIERFIERFAAYGFRREALMPVYGMAENSVGLAFPEYGRGPLIDSIDREIFIRSGKAVPLEDNGRERLRIVACGRPLPEHEIRVVDRSGHELPERQEGHIQFRGPSACSGYFHNPAATAELFDGDWLNSGDLGYISHGDIYISGRSKDMIIIAGRNIYPTELEEAIAELEGIRKGNVAVFGSTDRHSGTERLVVLAETRATDPQILAQLRNAVNELSLRLVGTPPHDLLLAAPQTVPKTSSGKIRRTAARELYEQGHLGQRHKPWLQYLRLTMMGLRGQLRRSRRWLAGCGFAGRSWGLYYLLLPPVYLAVMLLPRISWRWAWMRLALRLLCRGCGIPLRVTGLGNLPKGPCVLVANHSSYLDGYALIAALPIRFGFVAKQELAESALLRVPLQRIGTEFVDRIDKQKGIEQARHLGRRSREGCSLMFFPEGTFTRIPGLREFHMGAFVAAAEAGLPVVPIVIRGTRSILRGDDKFPHQGSISIRIGRPLDSARLLDDADEQTVWSRAIKLRDRCRDDILRHCGEPDLARK